ncbi:PAS domain-containing sensor histidine kinase [Mucilaginibacter gilvus]|uniref:histidine kinase n=1 Tax=Mucilaginibacter gilvus TaxID=2305909 RepID=A0A3S3W6A8_9SPHI|nr:PAS domain-containing sensor histidine kinase [Mucilaginibacter gilvus]RWY49387.1 PAS domain-containing sensor histidine kinase [Mucilaginibacter gilvus]
MLAPVFNSAGNAPNNYNLELFFELSPDLLCIAGYDGFFKRINPTVANTLGYSNEELFASPINSFVHPDDQQLTASSRQNLTKNVPLLNFENRYLTKTGEVVWLSWTSMPIENERLVFAIAKNITHKKKQEEARNTEIANLTRTNNDLKQLTYATSHDLRSPVSNLLSVFSLLNTNQITDPETLEFIGMLKTATDSLKNTLNGYMDALSQNNVLNVSLELLDLNECLGVVLLSLRSFLKDSRAVIDVDFSELPTVKFNRVYLESVFLNLITNSVKYAQPDSVPVIIIRSHRRNGISELVYTDQGRGFDMEKVQDRLFGFNQTFHNDKNADSKGVGLYLVYNHITSLGGHITVDSEVNKGARFNISFRD